MLKLLPAGIADLRRAFPTWSWETERDGMGWMYIGTKDGQRVEVRRYAHLFDDSGTHRSQLLTDRGIAPWMDNRLEGTLI